MMGHRLDPQGHVAKAVARGKTPYGQGFSAAYGGGSMAGPAENPYPHFTRNHEDWAAGHKDAREKQRAEGRGGWGPRDG